MPDIASDDTENLESLSDRADELYGDLALAVQAGAVAISRKAIDPDKVAKKIQQALAAKRPRPEVIVGNDAKYLMRAIGALPTRLREAVTYALFKLPTG